MTWHHPDLGSASDWLCCKRNLLQPIRSTTQICVVTCCQYGISTVITQTSLHGETSGNVTKCWPFSQAVGLAVYYMVIIKGCNSKISGLNARKVYILREFFLFL